VRTLTLRELNRAVLARQGLLERWRVGAVEAVERLAGVQAQWPPAPYVGLWSRVEGFRREELERALAAGELVKATVMRQTLHLVTPRDYGLFRGGMQEMNFPWNSMLARRLAPVVRPLAEGGDVTSAAAMAVLDGHDLGGLDRSRAWRYARAAAHLVHHHETALWRSRPEGRFVALDEPEPSVPVEARAEMLRRYLAAFGPATPKDMSAWSMMHMPKIRAALDLLELERFRDEDGRELLDVPGAPLPAEETPAPVRFLPKFDNVLLAWADRRRVLGEELRKLVVRNNGDVAQTFLVDGVVAGTWQAEGGRVAVEPFAPLSKAARAEVDEEAARLEAWLC
jgi:uncharacterized protein YcaQ